LDGKPLYVASMAQPAGGAPAKRLSLVERQKKLMDEKRWWSAAPAPPAPAAADSPLPAPRKLSFAERQDAAAIRQGRSNATAASRRAVAMPDFDEDEPDSGHDGAESSVSRAPSLHPSMAGTVISKACSEVTIGAGDGTGYWDFQHRAATRGDLGHNCRECKLPFTRVGEPLTERRGARLSMRYHAECFSGYADPRSQAESSHHVGRLAGTQHVAAPMSKAGGKMRTGTHFDSGSDSRFEHDQAGRQAAASGKLAMNGMHSGGFGANSSKPFAGASDECQTGGRGAQPPLRAPGDLTEQALAAHLHGLLAINEDA